MPLKPEERNPEQTRARLVAAAGDLFANVGVQAVSVDDIAAKAGVTKITLYKYFPTKDDLLIAALRKRNEERLRSMRTYMERATADRSGAEAVLELFNWQEHRFAEVGNRGCAFLNASAEVGAKVPEVKAITRASKVQIRAEIAATLEKAGYGVSSELTDALFLLLEAVTSLAAIETEPHAANAARLAARSLLGAAKPITSAAATAAAGPAPKRTTPKTARSARATR